MSQQILVLNKFSKIYDKGKTGVFDASFTVKKGDFHAFIGENGAGKTTIIKSVIGAYTQFEGEILINSISNRNPKSRQGLGYVPEVALFPKNVTTFNYLLSLGMLSGISKDSCIQKIDHFLEKLQITNLKNKYPTNFSSGQKKKVLLIQALLCDPEIIVLDEPASNLDVSARFELFSILEDLNKQGITIFISSHILSEIDKYANSLTLIHKGQVLYNGKKYNTLENIFYEKVLESN
ncbi:ABC transporter ATP-binding protein [Mycoplasma sp. Ms02]|uniref:ABC transporter ATP-binding protein n=1 Tax=Mycoplasma sp. Ms02 TaxID=353851 RepID=UPI001C8AC414|nr:ABC transporter ATP-binding protein [Mycoplasma sp. Ms02]QZE12544.1 ABC transporter ATP-binding protein [Mycoplasma sp. Ms02]